VSAGISDIRSRFSHMAESSLAISSSCIWRWVQLYVPEVDKRRVLLTDRRDAAAAKLFFRRALLK